MKTTLNSQAILAKYLPATNHRGPRIKAWCERGSITADWDHSLDGAGNAELAAEALRADFVSEDAASYARAAPSNPWAAPLIGGAMPGGGWCFVFAPQKGGQSK